MPYITVCQMISIKPPPELAFVLDSIAHMLVVGFLRVEYDAIRTRNLCSQTRPDSGSKNSLA